MSKQTDLLSHLMGQWYQYLELYLLNFDLFFGSKTYKKQSMSCLNYFFQHKHKYYFYGRDENQPIFTSGVTNRV